MDAYGLAVKIADLYLGNSPAKPSDQLHAARSSAVKADPAGWDAFLGTYRLGPGWLLTITREGDQLMTQATREDKFKMTPMSDTRFFVEGYGSAVEFVRENFGRVTHLLYRGINAPKLDLAESRPARLAAYVGDYWSEELQIVCRLEIHDGKLAIHQRSGAWLHFWPTEADRFDRFYAEAGAMVLEFTRNPASELTEMKVSGNRVRHIRYMRVTLPQAGPAEPNSRASTRR
jgi:hypothetical protein